ncbi:MAG: endonuclease III [Clostridia bacterium]|nr:endonuclease III [Clostridia bacterium]
MSLENKSNNNLLNEKQITEVINILEKEYKGATCGLDYNNVFELLVALILAAQCTDLRVNKIRPILFNRFKNVYEMAKAEPKEISKIIHSCGFYNNKTKSILGASNIIVSKYNGKVPGNMEDLTTLPGIGRKSSNIILQECFNVSVGIAVDTHVSRISKRLGLTTSTNPIIIERDLMEKLEKNLWNKINHILVYHGRAICDAKKPKCDKCMVNHICKYYNN